MLRLVDTLIYLIIFFCFTFTYICGKHQDLSSLCEVEIMIPRGETKKTAPEQSLTVKCPVKHCGRSLKVTWCKLHSIYDCEWINETENIEIRQDHVMDKLISYLSFKEISIHDDGLYKCGVIGYSHSSHSVNISVSDKHSSSHVSDISMPDKHLGVKNSDNKAEPLQTDGNEDKSWIPYFSICAGIIFLIFTLIILTHLSFYGRKRVLPFTSRHREEMPTHMIPGLPKWSAPSTPVLTRLPVVNDIYSSSRTETPKCPSTILSGNQPSFANAENKSEASDNVLYAVIKGPFTRHRDH
ncbi:uncharacterized protein KZ484_014674 [Pholidichthys leucotaenia]